MKSTSLTRRLLASAAGLTIAAAGVLGFAAPASATGGPGHGLKLPSASLSGEPLCDSETGTWTITYDLANNAVVTDATITELSSEVDGFAVGDVVPAGGEPLTATQTVEPGTEFAELTVKVSWTLWEGESYSKSLTQTLHDGGELGECEQDVPPPPPPPDDEEPVLQLTDSVFFGCDLFVLALRNDGEEDGATLQLTPNADTVQGGASSLVDQIGNEGGFEVPEDFALEDTSDIAAGETVNLGPLGVGEAVAHGFEPVAGLTVSIVVLVGDEVAVEVELPWEALLEEEGIECEEDGEGGELPATGASTGLIALGAVVLLAVGGGLFLIARRRRVTFTA